MKKKKILVLGYHFKPAQNPRAYRTEELVKEFARQGHEVTLVLPIYDYDYIEFIKKNNVKIDFIKPGFFLNKNTQVRKQIKNKPYTIPEKKTQLPSLLKKIIRPIFTFFYIDGSFTEYALSLSRYLLKQKKQYDVLISIAYPFSVHLGVALACVFKKNIAKMKLAEYSDPFSNNPSRKNILFHNKFIEKRVIDCFDRIVIPTKLAIKSYTEFIDEDKIHVIPQGFNLDEISLPKYQQNEIPNFAYAGAFYQDIRNPENLLKYLCTIENDFRFVVYTNLTNAWTTNLLYKYKKKLKEKLILNNIIPRESCIYELSKMDFLININNTSTNQSPSKVIDYALTKRPFLSFNQNNFNTKHFNEFLEKNYKEKLIIDINKYDIKNICKKFIKLFEE